MLSGGKRVRRQDPAVMLSPTLIPYERLSGLDIETESPAGEVRRHCSLAPNRETELTDLAKGSWVVRNNSPFIVRLNACSENRSIQIRTLCSSESWSFDWTDDQYTLTAKPQISAQVFPMPSVESNTYLQQARALHLNRWEYLFFQYMTAARTGCRRVPESTSQTPDFTINLAKRIVPVELKEFDRNKQEQDDARLLSRQGFSGGASVEIGHRLAKLVNSSRSQLRSFLDQHGDGPAILGVVDPYRLGHARPHHVAAVLEGHMVVRVARRDGSHIDTFRKENRRRAPHKRNAILSAIAVLNLSTKEGYALDSSKQPKYENYVANLDIYHNPHAKQPVSPSVFARFGFPQYSFGSTDHSVVQAFV